MKARYRYRTYLTDRQQKSVAQLFGCVRVVWNDALALCKQFEKKTKSAELQKIVITQAKKTEERAWLDNVSCCPLQQSVADLEIAFKNFFDFCQGKRKGQKVRYSRFKKRTSSQSAKFTLRGFSIADTRKDLLHKLSTKIVNENKVIVWEDLDVSGTVKNRKLSRAISQQGWYEFRTLCEAKSEKLGKEFRVISRWEPTSQVCADCKFKWGKIDLSIRSVLGLNCGTEQDRDEKAARNIAQAALRACREVGMGNRHDSKWAQRDCNTTSVARPDEASRITAHKRTVSISSRSVL